MQDWNFNGIYAFPPFSLIGRLLQRIERDRVDVKAVLPLWPSQGWFSQALRLLTERPLMLPKSTKLIHLPQDVNRSHPLSGTLRLTLFCLSGDHCKQKAFRMRQPKLSVGHGGRVQRVNTNHTCPSGYAFAIEGHLIQCNFLNLQL